MKFVLAFMIGCFLFTSCSYTKKEDLYEFLAICNHEFYFDFGVHIQDTLSEFETLLIEEGHLISPSGESYKSLLASLKKDIYFNPPLKKDNFNNVMLYKNPEALIVCAQETFNVDSVKFYQLPFYTLSSEISNTFTTKETLAIQDLFNFYLKLPKEEFEYPFVKENILLLFYRWYFRSKYDRSIPLTEDHKMDK